MIGCIRLYGAITALLIISFSASTHHGIAWVEEVFSEIHGKIVSITFANPHPTIEVDTEDGLWRVDLARLARLERAGLEENTAEAGDEITVLGNRSRDENEKRIKAVRVTVGGKNYDGYPERIPVDGVVPKSTGWTGTLERLDLVRAAKTSFILYPIVSATHIFAIATIFLSTVLMDLRLLGRFHSIPEADFVVPLRRAAVVAFVVALSTGGLMFAVWASVYVKMDLFWIKMFLILLAGLNVLVFVLLDCRRIVGVPLAPAAQVSAVLLIFLWASVVFAGRFLGFV